VSNILVERDIKREGEKMPSAKKICQVDPVPRYIMPDASEPDYRAILEQLQDYQSSLIGSSFYYIRAGEGYCTLCRIVPGGGKIFFHEIVDHEKHGISEDDLEEAIQHDTGKLTIPSHYSISPHIEQKLRVLLDFQ
jgi:hypothetical protein